jgi:multimeric flavodoxin WrbA
MKITAVYGSPRAGGNTDLLLAEFVRGARETGAAVTEIALRDYKFSPCIECGSCNETGICVLKDDMDVIYTGLREADILCLAAPVFFYGPNAQTKALIDRSQCFWAGKYLINRPLGSGRGARAKAYLISVGATKGQKIFDCMLLTMRYFFDALDMEFGGSLLYKQIDAKGAVREHPTAMKDAFELGKSAVVG